MYSYRQIAKDLRLDRLSKIPFLSGLKLTEKNVLILLAIATGLAAGFASVLFRKLLEWMEYFFLHFLYEELSEIHPYLLPLIPMLGAVLLIPFAKRYPGEVGGYGLPKFLIAVNLRQGFLKTRTIFLKIITSSITIGSGGAAGVEGPIAQIGGAAGSMIGRFFQLSSNRIVALVSCGAAAGIAAQFNAPIAGVLFAQEIILLGVFELEVFSAIIIASGFATAVSRAFYSAEPTFGALSFHFSTYELPFFIILGLIIGFFSAYFIRLFYATTDFFEGLKIPPSVKPILGAFIVGCLGLIHFRVLSDGYSTITSALDNPYEIGGAVLLLLFFLKFIATPITLGSGNVGGVFSPCLFLGAMIGGAFGVFINLIFPQLNISPATFAFVGMGAFLASTVHAPLTSIFLLFELTNDYQVIIPIMLASVFGMLISRNLCEDSIDTYELARQGIHLEHGKEKAILQSLKVSDIYIPNCETVRSNMTFTQLLQVVRSSEHHLFPVVNQRNELCGILSLNDIREFLLEEGLGDLIIVEDIMESDLITVFPENNLNEAMDKFASKDIDALPVVDSRDTKKFLGMLTEHHVIRAYNKATVMKIAEDAN